jgi:dihydrofolate reductase
MKTRIALIAAVGPDGTIGSGNKMPWHMPRDLRFFRRVTTGHTVIMGRKTFEAIGSKPLPRRKNIVVTRNPQFEARQCQIVHSLDEALETAHGEKRVFIIGGGELYRQSMDIADEIYLTHISDSHPNQRLFPLFESDTFFPEVKESDWIVHRQGRQFSASNKLRTKPAGAASGMVMQFVTYKRRHPKSS